MKRILLFSLLVMSVFVSCKKDEEETKKTSAPITITTSGLSATTDISLEVTTSAGINILTLVKQYGNKGYETASVAAGETITAHVSSTIANDVAGNGQGDLTFNFNGKVVYVWGGNLSGKTGKSATFKLP